MFACFLKSLYICVLNWLASENPFWNKTDSQHKYRAWACVRCYDLHTLLSHREGCWTDASTNVFQLGHDDACTEQSIFCISLVCKLSTKKVKGIICAPARAEACPTRSVWVFSIQPTTHTQTCSVHLPRLKSVVYSQSSYFNGTFFNFQILEI